MLHETFGDPVQTELLLLLYIGDLYLVEMVTIIYDLSRVKSLFHFDTT